MNTEKIPHNGGGVEKDDLQKRLAEIQKMIADCNERIYDLKSDLETAPTDPEHIEATRKIQRDLVKTQETREALEMEKGEIEKELEQ